MIHRAAKGPHNLLAVVIIGFLCCPIFSAEPETSTESEIPTEPGGAGSEVPIKPEAAESNISDTKETKRVIEKAARDERDVLKTKAENKNWAAEYTPINREADDPWQILLLDVLIPGYGMFYLEKYPWAAGYALGKIIGALLIYFSVDRYLFWKPLKDEFVSPANLASGESFNVSGSNSLTARDILNRTDTSIVLIMLSVTFEVLVMGVSFWHTIFEYSLRSKEGAYYKINLENTQETKTNQINQLNQLHLKFGYRFAL